MPQSDRQAAIESFVKDLGAYHADMVFNPWSEINELYQDHQGPAGRQERLKAHLDCDAQIALIGEAGGYQGLAVSGVAFTSERLLCNGAIPRIVQTPRLTGRPRPWSEPSATIVWDTLYELGIEQSTVLWNAFPYHPFGGLQMNTNRTPTRKEAKYGHDWLRRFAALHPNAKLVAVGKVSARAIEEAGLEVAASVRHPAYGGAPHFKRGLEELLAKISH